VKVRNTRRQKALELLETVRQGPTFLKDVVPSEKAPFTTDPIRNYALWVDTWVIPALNELIPELKAIKKAQAEVKPTAEPTVEPKPTSERDLVLAAHKRGGIIEAVKALRKHRYDHGGYSGLDGCKAEIETILQEHKDHAARPR
jgi:hypothetical protein